MYHKATKKIEHFDFVSQQLVMPKSSNGYKFELFVQNFLPNVQNERFGILQVDRATEFSPVKDADGSGSAYTPSTARKQLLDEATVWLQAVPNI